MAEGLLSLSKYSVSVDLLSKNRKGRSHGGTLRWLFSLMQKPALRMLSWYVLFRDIHGVQYRESHCSTRGKDGATAAQVTRLTPAQFAAVTNLEFLGVPVFKRTRAGGLFFGRKRKRNVRKVRSRAHASAQRAPSCTSVGCSCSSGAVRPAGSPAAGPRCGSHAGRVRGMGRPAGADLLTMFEGAGTRRCGWRGAVGPVAVLSAAAGARVPPVLCRTLCFHVHRRPGKACSARLHSRVSPCQKPRLTMLVRAWACHTLHRTACTLREHDQVPSLPSINGCPHHVFLSAACRMSSRTS